MRSDDKVSLAIPADLLRPVVRAIVAEVLEQLEADRRALPEKVFTEAEAAAYLGVAPHVLRDARLRGEVSASKIAGRRVRYTAEGLRDYLASRRTG